MFRSLVCFIWGHDISIVWVTCSKWPKVNSRWDKQTVCCPRCKRKAYAYCLRCPKTWGAPS